MAPVDPTSDRPTFYYWGSAVPEPAESLRLRLSPYLGRYARNGEAVPMLLYQDGSERGGLLIHRAGRDGVTFVEGEWYGVTRRTPL